MGHIPQDHPALGPYSVEIRMESFYLQGESADSSDEPARHGITVYPGVICERQGTVELLTEDIPALHAALDMVEWVDRDDDTPVFDGVAACYEVVSADGSQTVARVRTEQQALSIVDVLGDGYRITTIPLFTSVEVVELLTQREQDAVEARHQTENQMLRLLAQAMIDGTKVAYEHHGVKVVTVTAVDRASMTFVDDSGTRLDLSMIRYLHLHDPQVSAAALADPDTAAALLDTAGITHFTVT